MQNQYSSQERTATQFNAGEFVTDGIAPPMAVADRGRFIVRTYLHLFGAVLAFVGIEAAIFASGFHVTITDSMLSVSWLVPLGAFVLVSYIATRFAHTAGSLPAQYLGLGLFVVAEAFIFVPLLTIANAYAPGAIQSAALCTLLGFGGLTLVAFGTRKDFSFLGGVLGFSLVCAMVAIVASVIFGFELGTLFSIAMVVVAGAYILYDTSNVLHHYPSDRYVAASLQLFASVALMLWYLLRIFMAARR
jgi:hypothetical protein